MPFVHGEGFTEAGTSFRCNGNDNHDLPLEQAKVLNAAWDEVAPRAEVWTTPLTELKANKEHRDFP